MKNFKRAEEAQKELYSLFKKLDGAIIRDQKKLMNIKLKGKEHFETLENAMAAVFGEVTDEDLLGIQAEKYIPDLLRDVFVGVMILFGHSFSNSVDT